MSETKEGRTVKFAGPVVVAEGMAGAIASLLIISLVL